MPEFLDFLYKAISPESKLDVLFYSIVVFVLLFGALWKFTKVGSVARYIFSLLCSIVYVIILVWIVPAAQSFEERTYSILIPRFDGARLSKHFGRMHFNQVLEAELHQRLSIGGLDSFVDTRSISFIVGTSDTSKIRSVKECYNANAAICGQVVSFSDGIRVRLTFSPGTVIFGCVLPDGRRQETPFNEIITKEYELGMTKSEFTLDNLVTNILHDWMLLIAAHLSGTNFELSEKIIRTIPELKGRFHGHTYEPFLLQQAAFAFARGGDTLKAMELYNQSFIEFENLKISMDTLKEQDQDLLPKIKRFSAVSKFQEGIHAFNSGNYVRGLTCLETAKETDSAFISIVDGLEITY